YDGGGRLIGVWKGYPSAPLGNWESACQAQLKTAAPLERIAAMSYDASGLPASVTVNGVTTQLAVDGFGRIVDAVTTLDAGKGTRRDLRRGYDVRGNLIWEAVYDEN